MEKLLMLFYGKISAWLFIFNENKSVQMLKDTTWYTRKSKRLFVLAKHLSSVKNSDVSTFC